MFTVRNLGGIALFLFGTTFLWLTPAFASKDVSTDSALWSITRVMALATMAGFLVATWALFQRDAWWENLAVGSAVLGLLTLAPFWIAAAKSEEATPAFTVFVEFLGIAGVFVLLLVPKLEQWVDAHVMGS
jgi:hypothetical protein